ncbi:unnamed protein product [Urochloa decumbens]|uniref:F-box domain-containing protein n=1 Tax=Urochloa decumbens TaxID=240449 RepID=A0ABC8ZY95_9POAL
MPRRLSACHSRARLSNPITSPDRASHRSAPLAMSMSKLAAVAAGGGWADLPRDLLESVLARLPVPDRLRFPAVCTAWHSASTTTFASPASASPLSPWLMLPFNPTARGRGAATAQFLSLAEGRAYAIPQPAPAASESLVVGSSPDGWLVTADAHSELHLVNPVTGAQLPLPAAATLPFVDAIRDTDGRVASYDLPCHFAAAGGGEEEVLVVPPETLAPDMLRFEVYEKAVVVSPPRLRKTTTSPSPAAGETTWEGYAVLLICHPLSRLVVARAGDAAWALLDAPARRCWVDAVVHAGPGAADGGRRRQVVYAMDAAGCVVAWDMGTATAPAPARSRKVAPPCRCSSRACAMSAACRKYLVELAPGRLLQVHRLRETAHARYGFWEPRPERVEYTTTGVELFEWREAVAGGGGGGRWVEVDGKGGASSVLGGRALFLGKNTSLCLCVPVEHGGGGEVRGNCVYFTDDGPWSDERCREVVPDVGVLDLAGGSYRPPRGAVRDLLWKWPPPVWVFPSLST